MHARSTPVHRKSLADPAATGVRLGVELRAAAEQEAYGSGMCLSHWIKRLVEEAISKANAHSDADSTAPLARGMQREPVTPMQGPHDKDPVQSQLDVEYAREMGELKP